MCLLQILTPEESITIGQHEEASMKPKVFVTPHIASASIRMREKMAEIAVANLLAGLNGQAFHTRSDLPLEPLFN
jgi:lactate dehydrogenase-like 2-hydroxyacid dehydrogenase